MIRFVRYAVLLLVGLALVVAWTAVDWGGSERTRVPAIELTPRERDGRQQPRRTGARRAERRETRSSPTDPGGGAAPAPALTATARSISETDLSRRIPVRGRDEVAQLAETFNEMLDRLERAFGAQRRLVDDAGHELKTPLTIVRGHLELLEDDPEPRREPLPSSWTSSTGWDGSSTTCSCSPSTSNRTSSTSPRSRSACSGRGRGQASRSLGRAWVVESRGRGVIVADRHRLTQALVQLGQNAVRHGGDAGPIAVGSAVSDGEARFWIRDGGRGIELRDQARIFERFRRGTGLPRQEGAGLGLAIVKAIAEAHHGRVELKSRPGAGATFTFVVPVDQPDSESTRSR